MKNILLFIVAVLFSLTTIAQEKFTEGEITMKQTMSSSNQDVNVMLSEIGEMITTTYGQILTNLERKSELASMLASMGSSLYRMLLSKRKLTIVLRLSI